MEEHKVGIKGDFYQHGLMTEWGLGMLEEVREALEDKGWNKAEAIKYMAWSYTITEAQAGELVEWGLGLLTEPKEGK